MAECKKCGGSGIMKLQKVCDRCDGTGQTSWLQDFISAGKPCAGCKGAGSIVEKNTCTGCEGTGTVPDEPCPTCGGTGAVHNPSPDVAVGTCPACNGGGGNKL
ncbi:MAG: zinc finger domain-containing protein [Nitrospirota bacterium]